MIKPIKIKQYKAKKGENITHLLIAMAGEMEAIKNKLNEVIEEINKK